MRVVPATGIVYDHAGEMRFSGDVWQADPISGPVPDGLRGNVFAYAPGSRSNWHIHSGEQAIIVLHGRGFVQWQGGEILAIQAGDWVHVTPGVPHWHGATPDSTFVHAAVTASGSTTWLEPVEEHTDPQDADPASG
jgi:quercetin dioxygenase-like cupin family protein